MDKAIEDILKNAGARKLCIETDYVTPPLLCKVSEVYAEDLPNKVIVIGDNLRYIPLDLVLDENCKMSQVIVSYHLQDFLKKGDVVFVTSFFKKDQLEKRIPHLKKYF